MTTEVEAKSLCERIAEAKQRLEREKSDKEFKAAAPTRARLKRELLRVLRVDVDQSDMGMKEGNPEIAVEGIWFSLDLEGDLVTFRRCERCGADELSAVYSIDTLANEFQRFYRHRNEFCRGTESQKPTLTTEDRLLLALRDFIAENTYQPE